MPSTHLLFKLPSPTFEMMSNFSRNNCQSGKDVCVHHAREGEPRRAALALCFWPFNLSAAAGSWKRVGPGGGDRKC